MQAHRAEPAGRLVYAVPLQPPRLELQDDCALRDGPDETRRLGARMADYLRYESQGK